MRRVRVGQGVVGRAVEDRQPLVLASGYDLLGSTSMSASQLSCSNSLNRALSNLSVDGFGSSTGTSGGGRCVRFASTASFVGVLAAALAKHTVLLCASASRSDEACRHRPLAASSLVHSVCCWALTGPARDRAIDI